MVCCGVVCCGGQAYESGEKQDTEKLAKELDGLEGGRSVDATAVKACVPLLPPLLQPEDDRSSPPPSGRGIQNNN